MSALHITQKAGTEYTVTVTDSDDSSTQHTVTVDPAYRDSLGFTTEQTEGLIRASFEFLLGREPKESILSEFNLKVISQYFPEYESKIRH